MVMEYIDFVPSLEIGCGGKATIFANTLPGEGKRRDWSDDFCFDFTCFQQIAKACLDEDSVHGSNGTRKKC